MDNQDTTFDELYITLKDVDRYYGRVPFEIGHTLILMKEPDNREDEEAIAVIDPALGKVGYVADSSRTTARGCVSAGRLYDFFAQECTAVVRFMTKEDIIARVFPETIVDISIDLTKSEAMAANERFFKAYLDLLKRIGQKRS